MNTCSSILNVMMTHRQSQPSGVTDPVGFSRGFDLVKESIGRGAGRSRNRTSSRVRSFEQSFQSGSERVFGHVGQEVKVEGEDAAPPEMSRNVSNSAAHALENKFTEYLQNSVAAIILQWCRKFVFPFRVSTSSVHNHLIPFLPL